MSVSVRACVCLCVSVYIRFVRLLFLSEVYVFVYLCLHHVRVFFVSQVVVVGETDGHNERRFYGHLVEDRASFPGGSMNYPEYMQHINRQSVGGMGM